jgi:streptogramin lyase
MGMGTDPKTALGRAAAICGALLLLFGFASASISISAAGAASTITEYTPKEPAEYHEPLSIVSAPDGGDALWFTVKSPAGFGEASLLPDGAVEKFSKYTLGAGEESTEIVDGPKDDLWATVDGGLGAGLVWGANDLSEGSLARTLGDPVGIVTDPEGDVWFTEQTSPPKIVQYDPSTSEVNTYTAKLETSGKPGQIVVGSDKNLWFVEDGGHSAIDRIEPGNGTITRYPTQSPSSEPIGLTVGPEGNVWFTELHGDAIGRITPAGTITEFSTDITQKEPAGIVAADNGDMYFTERGGEGAVGQITPAGTITELTPATTSGLTKNNQPWAITTGPDGNVWFTEIGGEPKIGRLTIAPGVISASASTPGASSVELKASVLPNLQESQLSFEYGATTTYGSTSSAVSVGKGTTASSGSVELTGLKPVTEYHYRAVASNASGITYGPDETFTTAAAPKEPPVESPPSESPTETPAKETSKETTNKSSPGESSNEAPSDKDVSTNTTGGGSLASEQIPSESGEPDPSALSPTFSPPTVSGDPFSAATPPVLGHSGLVGVASGTVLVRNPATGLMEPLGSAANIPAGALIDAAHGVVALTTALPGGGQQTASVWGGSFTFSQAHGGNGMTNLYLRGPVGPCASANTAAHDARDASASASRAVTIASATGAGAHQSATRELWSKDSHGRYTTHGANSAATVLGTEWLTVDSCAGTLTRVREGRVRVRDLHTHGTTIVTAGHSYLAPRR